MRSGGLNPAGQAWRRNRPVWRDHFAGGLGRSRRDVGALGASLRLSWVLAALPILDVMLAQVQARWD
ncbi:MAG: hypothetical protein AMJ81_14700, partial [Phycisphaerae bacterium SM23_33]